MKKANKSLHWIFTPLRFVKTSEFKRYTRRIGQKVDDVYFLSFHSAMKVFNGIQKKMKCLL